MQVIRDLSDFPTAFRGGIATIGNFDGVHRGHARLVERLLERARARQAKTIVFTFDPHPAALLRPDGAPTPLTWPERKAELLGDLGVDCVVNYATNRALLDLSPAEFFQLILCEKLGAVGLVEGPNFYFGRGRSGDVRHLGALCQAAGISLDIVEPQCDGAEVISSSRVRALIQQGQVGAAADLLTAPYRIRGIVVRGAGRGAGLGFPTANLSGIDTLVPTPGVYAGRAWVEGQAWPAAAHLGPLPTFGVTVPVVEVHLIGYQGDLYGQRIELDFFERLRDIRRFQGIDDLQQQLAQDIRAAAACAQDFRPRHPQPKI